RRCAGCPGRRCAGGVGPFPSSRRLPRPPVPGRGLPDLVRPPRAARPEPDRPEDPPLTAAAPYAGTGAGTGAGTTAGARLRVQGHASPFELPPGPVRGVLDEYAGRTQPLPDRVGRSVVPAIPGRL